ncbi:unnamed protein product [Trichobilharzia regenti]|nr:unnamed protein product [Trichobilharzia regenti]
MLNTLRQAKYENNASASVSSKSIPECLFDATTVLSNERRIFVGSGSSYVEFVEYSDCVDEEMSVVAGRSLTAMNKANGEPMRKRFAN